MTRRSRDMQRLASALDEVLESLQPPAAPTAPATTSDSRTVGGVFGRWHDAVGPQVALHARPVKLSAGRLLVEVDEPGWASQLRFLEADVLARIETVVGPGVTAIDVRVARR